MNRCTNWQPYSNFINKMKNLFVLFLLISTTAFSQPKKISIIVDERVELITSMQLLFGYPLVGKADINYKKEVLDYFSKYENDTSVLYFLNIAQKGLGFSLPFVMVYHYTFPGFKQQAPFSNFEETNFELGKHPEWKDPFMSALKRFYKVSTFNSFYKNHTSFYDSLINTVSKTVDSVNLLNIMESHYGVKQHSYTLVLSPLSIEAGYSISIKGKHGNDLYSIIGPNLDSKVTPNFDARWLMQSLVLHEFSHPFCNPLIDDYWSSLEKDSCLFNPIRKAMQQQGCGDWKSALKEHLTRANEIVLIEKVFGKEDADKVYNEYLGQKWIYIKGLIPIIKEYAANRDRYKILNDIMPKVIAYFDNEAMTCNK